MIKTDRCPIPIIGTNPPVRTPERTNIAMGAMMVTVAKAFR